MTVTRQLTQTHRAQQLLLRRATIAQLQKLWPALDWAALDATYPAFAVQVAKLVQTNRQTSAGLAAAYLRAFRRAANVPGEVKVVFAQPLVVEQFATSLRVSSVVALKNAAAAGTAPAVALANARTLTEGSMARLVLNAGRETVTATVAADSRASGWRRVLGGSGCAFCRMLAGRGAVYSESTVDFASHDRCGCTGEPEYGGDAVSVRGYVPTTRKVTDVDRARVRDWIKANPTAN